MAESNLISTAINVFASPTEAYPVIKERPRPLFPVAIIVVVQALAILLYMNQVDLGWLMEMQIRSSPAIEGMSETEIQQAANQAAQLGPITYGAIGSIAGAIFLTLAFFVYALYLKIVSIATKDGHTLKQWFGLVCWCTLPVLLSQIAALVNIVSNDVSFMPQERVNPLSFSSLLSLETEGASGIQRFVQNFDLTTIWTFVLITLGYRAWTGKPLFSAAAVAIAPYAVIVGIGFTLITQ